MKEFDHDRIQRYLDGEMNADELKSFEADMLLDVELQQEAALVREVQDTLQIKLHPGEGELALKQTLQELNGEYFRGEKEQARVVPMHRKRWITAVAAIFIMVLVLTVWRPWENENLYEQYAAIQMPGSALRGNVDSLLNTAVDHFNNKRFAEAIPAFETVLGDSTQSPADAQNTFVQYYYAIALLQNGNIAGSRTQLTELYNGSSSFKYDAAFYMALSYLKEKDKNASREWLNKIPSGSGPHAKATELMKKL